MSKSYVDVYTLAEKHAAKLYRRHTATFTGYLGEFEQAFEDAIRDGINKDRQARRSRKRGR